MRDRTQYKRRDKITNICGEGTRQNSKPRQMNKSEMSNHH